MAKLKTVHKQKRHGLEAVRGESGYIQIEFEIYKRTYIEKVMHEWKDRGIIA